MIIVLDHEKRRIHNINLLNFLPWCFRHCSSYCLSHWWVKKNYLNTKNWIFSVSIVQLVPNTGLHGALVYRDFYDDFEEIRQTSINQNDIHTWLLLHDIYKEVSYTYSVKTSNIFPEFYRPPWNSYLQDARGLLFLRPGNISKCKNKVLRG